MGEKSIIDLGALGAAAAAVLPRTAIPRTFVGFCSWLGVTLTPGQRVLVSIAYDGLNITDLSAPDQQLARKIFGNIPDVIDPQARSILDAVCGGRGGKSYILVALRLVYGALVRDLSSLAPGQRAVALIIAPNDTLRREVVSYALGAMRSHPSLAERIILPKGHKEDDTVDSFQIRRPDGHLVKFEAGIAARGGYGGRGRSLTDFSMDESAFFRDSGFQVNDSEIFKAASPRVLPGGQTIVASTPWAESGLLYELWLKNFGKPTSALVAHAPTLILQDNEFTRSIVARERERDLENARREFDAEFMTSGSTIFFEPSLIQQAIDESINANVA